MSAWLDKALTANTLVAASVITLTVVAAFVLAGGGRWSLDRRFRK